jgi:hypothetical protein
MNYYEEGFEAKMQNAMKEKIVEHLTWFEDYGRLYDKRFFSWHVHSIRHYK